MSVALVTGAAKRLGRELAMQLARTGWDIAAHYLSSENDAKALAADVKALGRKNHSINGVAAQVLASFGGKAEEGKPALLAALKEADESDKPQIVWALVSLKEPSVFKDAM